MSKGVFLHVRLLVKSLAAVLARIRPRVGVDQQMSGQRRRTSERLAALRAAVYPTTGPDLVYRPSPPNRRL